MRYIILVLINLTVITFAFLNLLTRYKMHKISARRFRIQVFLWLIILLILVGSFPIYNQLSGRPPLDSNELSLFDMVEVTAIITLIYVVNNLRQRLEWNERTLRDLHQELSIRLSTQPEKINIK